MADTKYFAIGGILTLIIALTTGTTMYIQSLGTKTTCSTGWEEYNSTHSVCNAAKTPRFEVCFKITDSKTVGNYYCEKGKIVFVEAEQSPSETNEQYETCTPSGCIKG